ncbi:Tho complex subunit 7-domain-containing protein [Pisolithus marmoratus]|nr:Tho complex subunit 7-domain-containing protein [Pisolithus marmoratus]
MTTSNAVEPESLKIPPLSVEEEDAIIHTRITNDERPLRRIAKKFHTYASLVHPLPVQSGHAGNIDDAREAFLIELSSFELSLKKSIMVCEAEARQVEEYQRERRRIEAEHDALRAQIAELKIALEHAQTERKRKIEYDSVAEKLTRFQAVMNCTTILLLENDMTAIRAEHETQERIIRGQKSALDGIITDLVSLRLLGKDRDVTPATTPAPELPDSDEGSLPMDDEKQGGGIEYGEVTEGKEDGEDDGSLDLLSSSKLGPSVQGLMPQQSGTPLSSQRESQGQGSMSADIDDDIEMGEVAEDPKPKRKAREDLEEGEASDSSSALSDPPDD